MENPAARHTALYALYSKLYIHTYIIHFFFPFFLGGGLLIRPLKMPPVGGATYLPGHSGDQSNGSRIAATLLYPHPSRQMRQC